MIVDDEVAMGRILVKSLTADGFTAVSYADPVEALAAIESQQPDIILTDVRMPNMTGQEVLQKVKAEYPEMPVLIMTAFGTIEDAVDALKAGAFNYITKPFQHANLVHQIELALEHTHLKQENIKLSDQRIPQLEARSIIGSSSGLKRVKELITRAAQTDSAVFVTGDSGVGKELVAREIHRQSNRREGRFVVVNCPAIPVTLLESELFGYERGAFTGADRPKMGSLELADGGTVFMDEVAELPVELQVKLLRTLQEHEVQRLGGLRQIPVDFRIITATNRDLDEEIKEGRFRLDFYYRLNVIPIHVPPLRQRPEDLRELVEFFLARIGRRLNRAGLTLTDEALDFFRDYSWPGNIRELENTLERMVVFSSGNNLGKADIPTNLAPSLKEAKPLDSAPDLQWEEQPSLRARVFKDAKEDFERQYLKRLLKECDGNVALASRTSGISRRTLYEKFVKLGLTKESIGGD